MEKFIKNKIKFIFLILLFSCCLCCVCFTLFSRFLFDATTTNTVVIKETPIDIFAETRNDQRQREIGAIYEAVTEYLNDPETDKSFLDDVPDCEDGKEFIGINGVNLDKFLVDDYILNIPTDPKTGTQLNTSYEICINADGVQINAPKAELGEVIVYPN